MVNSESRPKINIPKSKSEWIWDTLGYAFYIGSIILLLAVWDQLPEKVPAHYGFSGEVDRWGSKSELLLLPGIGFLILVTMQALERFPEVHNYPDRLNASNAPSFYLNSRKMLNQVKNICLVIFALISLESVSVAMKWTEGTGIWLLPILVVGALTPVVIGFIKQAKIK